MRFIILAAAALTIAASASSATPPTTKAQCPNDPAKQWARAHQGAELRKLNQLPPAEAYAAVYKRGPDGCMIPVLFRERLAPAKRPR